MHKNGDVKDPVVCVKSSIYDENIQHALVELGSAALAGCCSLTQVRWTKLPARD